jgi:hypothetical protein
MDARVTKSVLLVSTLLRVSVFLAKTLESIDIFCKTGKIKTKPRAFLGLF